MNSMSFNHLKALIFVAELIKTETSAIKTKNNKNRFFLEI
jgi:hypothetical protein